MIIKQGERLPAFDSLSDEERRSLQERVDRVLLEADKGLTAEIIAVRSIGNQGDARTYDVTVFLRALPKATASLQEIGEISTRIINETNGVGRVLFDVTPPKIESGST